MPSGDLGTKFSAQKMA